MKKWIFYSFNEANLQVKKFYGFGHWNSLVMSGADERIEVSYLTFNVFTSRVCAIKLFYGCN